MMKLRAYFTEADIRAVAKKLIGELRVELKNEVYKETYDGALEENDGDKKAAARAVMKELPEKFSVLKDQGLAIIIAALK